MNLNQSKFLTLWVKYGRTAKLWLLIHLAVRLFIVLETFKNIYNEKVNDFKHL